MEQLITGTAKTVTSAGTAEALSATGIRASSIVIQAKTSNTDYIWVGDSTVDNASGHALGAEDSVIIGGSSRRGAADEFDPADIYIDAEVSGEGVNWFYIKPKH